MCTNFSFGYLWDQGEKTRIKSINIYIYVCVRDLFVYVHVCPTNIHIIYILLVCMISSTYNILLHITHFMLICKPLKWDICYTIQIRYHKLHESCNNDIRQKGKLAKLVLCTITLQMYYRYNKYPWTHNKVKTTCSLLTNN